MREKPSRIPEIRSPHPDASRWEHRPILPQAGSSSQFSREGPGTSSPVSSRIHLRGRSQTVGGPRVPARLSRSDMSHTSREEDWTKPAALAIPKEGGNPAGGFNGLQYVVWRRREPETVLEEPGNG